MHLHYLDLAWIIEEVLATDGGLDGGLDGFAGRSPRGVLGGVAGSAGAPRVAREEVREGSGRGTGESVRKGCGRSPGGDQAGSGMVFWACSVLNYIFEANPCTTRLVTEDGGGGGGWRGPAVPSRTESEFLGFEVEIGAEMFQME